MPPRLRTDHDLETRAPHWSVTVEGTSSPDIDRALSGQTSRFRHIRLVETASPALTVRNASLMSQAEPGRGASDSGFAA